ncbi:MAG: isochorismatase family protein [Methylocaldum sp.]|nr:isochorismatase family protein [Methylocaldum sp.]
MQIIPVRGEGLQASRMDCRFSGFPLQVTTVRVDSAGRIRRPHQARRHRQRDGRRKLRGGRQGDRTQEIHHRRRHNDVCTVFPALSLVREGYAVQVIADAGGSPSQIGDDMALRRMEKNGVTLSSTNQVIAELAGNWSTPEGSAIVQQVVMPALQG